MNYKPTKDSLRNQTILVTGGTGSFGQRFTQMALKTYSPKKLIIFSRDELKQSEMAKKLQGDPRVRFFLGDVRDVDRLRMAFRDVDIVVHAAALKQVPTLEYNPFEAVKTNVIGAQNIILAAIDQKVKKVIALSTDKAVNPVNLYGATKLCAERLFVDGNFYSGPKGTIFSVVRYGNVMGSRGSVIPFFLEKRKTGILPVTDKRMTRFWITLEQGVYFVLTCLDSMKGGEIFIPKIPSMGILDLAKSLAPECKLEVSGIRPGEKLNEVLITEEESRNTIDRGSMYVIQTVFSMTNNGQSPGGRTLPSDFRYSSETNEDWLKPEDMKRLLVQEAAS